jgi:hypothetical protein
MTPRRTWALASAAVAVATTTVYAVAVGMEGDDAFWDVFPWVTLMVLACSAALWSALSRDPGVGRSMAIAAAAVLAILGVVAIFSVGVGFVLAAVLAARAAAEPSTNDRRLTGPARYCRRGGLASARLCGSVRASGSAGVPALSRFLAMASALRARPSRTPARTSSPRHRATVAITMPAGTESFSSRISCAVAVSSARRSRISTVAGPIMGPAPDGVVRCKA